MRSAAGPWRKVVDRWIGGATAPVSTSGSAPACTARVSSRIACFLLEAELAQVRAQRRQVTVMVRMQPGLARGFGVGCLVVDEQHLVGCGDELVEAGVEDSRVRFGQPELCRAEHAIGEQREQWRADQIGRAQVWTPVTNAHLVCRLLLTKQKKARKH